MMFDKTHIYTHAHAHEIQKRTIQLQLQWTEILMCGIDVI